MTLLLYIIKFMRKLDNNEKLEFKQTEEIIL